MLLSSCCPCCLICANNFLGICVMFVILTLFSWTFYFVGATCVLFVVMVTSPLLQLLLYLYSFVHLSVYTNHQHNTTKQSIIWKQRKKHELVKRPWETIKSKSAIRSRSFSYFAPKSIRTLLFKELKNGFHHK